MRFSQDFIEKVKDANDVVDIISQYTTFKSTGSNMMGLCPFPDHKEKTPSFSASPSKQAYFCFGCKKGGNVINFLMDYNGMSFVEAIEYLAKRASIPIPQNENFKSQSQQNNNKTYFKLTAHATKFYKDRLLELEQDSTIWTYIKNRGLSAEVIEIFKIGYAPKEWSSFSDYLNTIKAPMSFASQLGLIKQKNNGYFDIFRDRLMFPILSPKGDVVGFGGRALDDENFPKYLNSPESPIFHKGKILYGLHETAKYIRSEDCVLVVEGYMDLVALYQYGFKNCVATLGTAFTEEHAKLVKRYTQNVIVLFDSDSAGIQAQERSLPILLSQNLLPKSIDINEAKDPDEYLKNFGAEKFKEKLKNAQDLFFTVLNRYLKTYRNTPTEKVSLISELATFLLSVNNQSLKDLYIQETALRMDVTPQWIYKALREVKAKPELKNQDQKALDQKSNDSKSEEVTKNLNESVVQEEIEKKIKIVNPPKEDIFLVNLALLREEFLKELIEENIGDKLEPSGLDLVFKRIVHEYRQKGAIFATLSSTLCSILEDSSLILWHLDESGTFGDNVEKLKNDCLRRVKKRYYDKMAEFAMQELKREHSPEKLEQFMNIVRERQALNSLKD